MKNTILFLLFIIGCNKFASGQGQEVERKVVTILPEQSTYLNGGFRAGVGGKSRAIYQIDLPENTIEWYYSFYTWTEGKGKENLELASQLTRIVDPSGLTQIAVKSLLAPSGVASADIYLMDRDNAKLFLQKAACNQIMAACRENYKQGVVPVHMTGGGTYFLGIRNPSAMEGINVNIEVAAIVEERKEVKLTESQEKAKLYGSMGWNAFLQRDYDKCLNLSKKALEFESNMPWVKYNIALCYLVQSKPEYLDNYVDAIACCKKSDNAKAYIQAAIKDIKEATRIIGNIPNSDEIVKLLYQELE